MKVLLTTYGGAHIALALPLLDELQTRGIDATMLALTTAGPVCERAGVPHQRPIDFARMQDPLVQRYGRQLAARHHSDGSGLTRDESIAYLGESFRELVNDVGEVEAVRQYEEQGLNALCPVRFFERVIAAEAPDVVVATDSPRMERAAMLAARNLGVPAVCVVCIFPHIGMHFLREPDYADTVCVCSEHVRQQLIAVGRFPESIVATGNPAWDSLAAANGDERRTQARKTHHLNGDDTVILWAEQPEPGNEELPRQIRRHLGELCQNEPHWKQLVRLHPSSTDPRGEVMPPAALVSPRTEPLLTALHTADVVITMTSTVGYEALLLGKPLIVLEMSQFSHTVDYAAADGALVVSSLDEVDAAIRTLTSDNSQSAKLRINRQSLPRPGGAAQRVADEIQQTQTLRKAG